MVADILRRVPIGTMRPMSKPTVLFLCVKNAGRSQMAASWMRHLAGDRVTVFSGGSAPGTRVHPEAIEVMGEIGIDLADQRPAGWTEEQARTADVVVTMGCGDVCPVYPGKRYLDWDLEDPNGKPLGVVRKVRDDIKERVQGLLEELGDSESND